MDGEDTPSEQRNSAAGSGSWGPLSSLRVVDMTQMLAGPYATMVLADLGADVVKIEPPRGDMTRDSPPLHSEEDAYGGYFQSVNRNKRSIAIDLKSNEGREAFLELVKEADVLVENFRVGTMDRLDLSYEDLCEHNPELIYASIRGFGDPRTGESPHANRPTFDVVAQAMGGLMSVNGTEDSGPLKAGPGVGDIFPAVLCCIGILSALYHRDRTGEGQYVDVSMVDGVLSLCERIVHQYSVAGDIPQPQGNTHPLFFPFDRFDTQDGCIMIAAPSDHQWRELCDAMGRPDLAEEYAEGQKRLERADDLRPIIAAWTAELTNEEIVQAIADDVPCGPVNDVGDIFEEPHFEARDMLPSVEHADTGEEIAIAGSPIKLTKTPSRVAHRAPFLGEHSREILAELGFDDQSIKALIEAESVSTPDDSE